MEQSASSSAPTDTASSLGDTNTVVSTDSKEKATLTMNDFVDITTAHYTFPERLMELLEDKSVEEALWWLPGGTAFCIRPKRFYDVVLARHFQGTKLESFTRKLNRWGFRRLASTSILQSTVAYYNKNFQRHQPELLKNMRSGNKGYISGVAATSTKPVPIVPPRTQEESTEALSLRGYLTQQSIVAARQAQRTAANQALLRSMLPPPSDFDFSSSMAASSRVSETIHALQNRARLRTAQRLALLGRTNASAVPPFRDVLASSAAGGGLLDSATALNPALDPRVTELLLLRARMGLSSGML